MLCVTLFNEEGQQRGQVPRGKVHGGALLRVANVHVGQLLDLMKNATQNGVKVQ